MKGYKFIPSQFADSFANGNIRISPAHVFRENDGIDDGRSDFQELTTTVTPEHGELIVNSSHPLIRNIWLTYNKDGERVYDDVIFGGSVQIIDNAYLFCLCSEYSEKIYIEMKNKFDADAVFEIENLENFCNLLRKIPGLSHMPMHCDFVTYSDAKYTSFSDVDTIPYFTKRTLFSWQKEYRICWFGEVFGDSIIVDVPEISSLLKRIQ
jgi:hypothetical protein